MYIILQVYIIIQINSFIRDFIIKQNRSLAVLNH